MHGSETTSSTKTGKYQPKHALANTPAGNGARANGGGGSGIDESAGSEAGAGDVAALAGDQRGGRGKVRPGSKAVAANSLWQLVTFAARAISGVGVVVLLAREGGPHSLGVFQFAVTFASMMPFYWGLPSLLAREVAREPGEAKKWAEGGTFIAIIAGAIFTVGFAIGVKVFGASPQTALALPLASVAMACDGIARVQFAVFWAWERMHLETIATCIQEAAFLIIALVVVAMNGGVIAVLVVFIASRALGALVGWAMVSAGLGSPAIPRPHAGFAKAAVRRSAPFAVNDTLTLTYMRADSVMLGLFKGPSPVGLYQAGTNLVLYMNVLARSLNYAIYPRMSKAWVDRRDQFGRLCYASYRILASVGTPIALGGLLLGPEIFRFLYGAKFDRAVLTYQLLVVVVPIRMIGNTMSLALSASDRQSSRTIAVVGAAALNVGLNFYFIPKWSYLGAAITTVICETGLLATYAYLVKQVAGRTRLMGAMALPAAACIPMGLTILALPHQELFVRGLAGLLVYTVFLLLAARAAAPAKDRRSVRAVLTAMVAMP